MNSFDWIVAAPMLCLALGSILCLMAGAFFPKNKMGSSLALLAIAGAFALQGRVWEAGSGIAFSGFYEVSSFTTLLGFAFLLLSAISWGFAEPYINDEEPKSEFFALLLMAPIGMFLMAGANNLLMLFIGIEILSIPLYLLCAFRKQKMDSVESGLKYFLLGAFAAAFFLFGASLLYAATGSLSLSEIAAKAKTLAPQEMTLFYAGVSLSLVGLLFKASLAPFHFWTPDVYEGAPTPVTALMSGGTKAAAFGALANFAPLFSGKDVYWLGSAAILTMFVGNLSALMQTNLKRLLAYSGIAHAGIVLVGILAWPAGASAKEAVLFYLVSYGLSATGAFGLISYLEKREGEDMSGIEGYRGLAQRRPVLALALTWFLLSLGGMPPTAGFLAKYFIFASAIQAKLTWLAVVGILFSVVSLAYYLKIIVTMYMLPSAEEKPLLQKEVQWSPFIALSAVSLGVLIFGIYPSWILSRV